MIGSGKTNPAGRETDEHATGAESECIKVMAEVERVLRELSLEAPSLRQSNAKRSNSVAREPSEQSLVSAELGSSPAALPPPNRLCLDPNLDFVVHDDGVIELTEGGFRRMMQIGVDRREVLRLSAPKLGHDPRSQANQRPRSADLIETHVQRPQPIAELLNAEESSEAAMNMINKERERREIEALLPWHAAGTLDRRDIEL